VRRPLGPWMDAGASTRTADPSMHPPPPRSRRSEGVPSSSLGGAGRKRQRSSSRYIGVYWNKAYSSWFARMTDPQTKGRHHIGSYASEEDAARAYDCAVVQARGPGAERNFPGETISELPATVGVQRKSSRFIGVSWDKRSSSFRVELKDSQTKHRRQIGRYASEEDAARAYDCAAVQAIGPGAERNFPDEIITELPVSRGDEQRSRRTSNYVGVSWHKASSSFIVQMRDPQTKHTLHIGRFASEKDAARAYDFAAVQAHGPGAKRKNIVKRNKPQNSVHPQRSKYIVKRNKP
jgi:hypothetical protein